MEIAKKKVGSIRPYGLSALLTPPCPRGLSGEVCNLTCKPSTTATLISEICTRVQLESERCLLELGHNREVLTNIELIIKIDI